jgi:hypothetical protein
LKPFLTRVFTLAVSCGEPDAEKTAMKNMVQNIRTVLLI